jgi:mRNA-degrading endonuclease RelE of RelBE toxin-antitoxin system
MYKIELERTVCKFLKKYQGDNIVKRFRQAIMIISHDPYNNNLDIVLLRKTKDFLLQYYRLRIGGYRFIFIIDDEITFINAGRRGDIYRGY